MDRPNNSPKARKPLHMVFPKRPPPRPSARKPPSSVLRVYEDSEETVGTTRRQIFLTSSTQQTRALNVESSFSSSSPSSSNITPVNRKASEDASHPTKKRKGTPKKPAVGGGKENSDSLDFLAPNETVSRRTSSAAKSLFQPSYSRTDEDVSIGATSVDDATIDPWEVARQLSPDQQRKQYWQLCYGTENGSDQSVTYHSWSAQRIKPNKSW